MVVYSFYIFDRHTECIYSKTWLPAERPPSQQPPSSAGTGAAPPPSQQLGRRSQVNSAKDDAKLIFGTVFSLRNMVRKLGGDDHAFISYRTSAYKLHYYETPSNLRFVMLTDTATLIVKNPLAPAEHKGGEGVKNELFELGLDQFVRGLM
ncbi:sybindin-like family protein [Colletotrichum tamarilloi]|uniref:Trafficking protein particle complex subunit n=1 Tax=Colletotrichum tamarilloi TaxID=1209934 RepID=A0ABQ9RPS2_9PEZI|nr:sybindin-like family protein [Colletotrichum tamarilloi]KAK1509748.1 sybindin-like family protein [Colletotrichum tamarilloi]